MNLRPASEKIIFCFFILFHKILAAGPGTAGGLLLSQPLGIRGSGMGEAGTAISGDPGSLYYNPAGLAGLSRRELSLLYQPGIDDDFFSSVTLALPGGSVKSCFGAVYYSAGRVDLVDGSGNETSMKAEEDYAAVFSLSRRFLGRIDMGAGIKYFSSTLIEEFTASAFTYDAGMLIHLIKERLTLGISALNLTGEIKYDQEADPVLKLLRAGLAFRVKDKHFNTALFSCDFVAPGNEESEFGLGAEYELAGKYAFRGGFRSPGERSEVSLGLGVRLGGMKLDYSWVPDGELGDSHRFALGFIMGKPESVVIAERKTEEERRSLIDGYWKDSLALAGERDYEGAYKKLDKLLLLDPSNEDARRKYAFCEEKIFASWTEKKKKKKSDKFYSRGLKLYNGKKYERSREYFEKTMKLNPKHRSAGRYIERLDQLRGREERKRK